MRFRIDGANATTGEDVSIFVEAPTRAIAEQMAARRKIVISAIKDDDLEPMTVQLVGKGANRWFFTVGEAIAFGFWAGLGFLLWWIIPALIFAIYGLIKNMAER
jgi:hypothetical protein